MLDSNNETAILLLEGKVKLEWEGHSKEIQRESLFEEEPWCLHVSKNVEVKITALANSEVLVQKRIMKKNFHQNYIRLKTVKIQWLVKEYGKVPLSVSFGQSLIIITLLILTLLLEKLFLIQEDGRAIRLIIMTSLKYITIVLTSRKDLAVQWLEKMHTV